MRDSSPSRAKQAILFWLAGFREACCLHRVAILCSSSRILAIRTGQCFLLNGFIYLGSIFVLTSVVVPVLSWILPEKCEGSGSQGLCGYESALPLYSLLRSFLTQLFYVMWLYPLYAFSLVLSTIWYNDIAKHGFHALRRKGLLATQSSLKIDANDPQKASDINKPGGIEGVILGIGELSYSILLLSMFFIEVYASSFIPYVGRFINFLLLSWIYAYYCFEYKWNLSELSLDKKLDLFESNWAFFAGFGSPCVLPTLYYSTLVSNGIMAVLFPLFVLTAAGTQEKQLIDSLRRSCGGGGPGRLQIFYAANAVSMLVLRFFPEAREEK